MNLAVIIKKMKITPISGINFAFQEKSLELN